MYNTVCEYYFQNFGNLLEKGFYIEIGAFNGAKQNSTIILEQAGWNGICVEPMPDNIRRLKKNRKCRIIEGAIWNKTGTVQIADVGIPGWTGISETHQQFHKQKYNSDTAFIDVNCYRFEDLKPPKSIDYLQVDTEGSELDILADIDTTKYHIECICIEDNLGVIRNPKYHDFMTDYGYELIYTHKQDKLYGKSKTS